MLFDLLGCVALLLINDKKEDIIAHEELRALASEFPGRFLVFFLPPLPPLLSTTNSMEGWQCGEFSDCCHCKPLL